MTDTPIIFSAPMVQALLREADEPGTGKTMTRRMLRTLRKGYGPKVDPADTMPSLAVKYPPQHDKPVTVDGEWRHWALTGWHKVKAGDRLWVREAAAFTIDQSTGKPAKTEWFLADGPNPYEHNRSVKVRPSIHMPRWASRLTLICTADARIERLQDISEADAIAEGIENIEHSANIPPAWRCYLPEPKGQHAWAYAPESFRTLWISLHGKEAWDLNPWAVALTFRVIEENIDRLESEAA